MKVLLLNGSPHEKGCMYTALSGVASALEKNGVETEIFHAVSGPVYGCAACKSCVNTGRCVYDDACNKIAALIDEADGVVLGSPVYYAGVNGAFCAVIDRVFYSAGRRFAGKVGASVVSCRRGGAGSAFDRLNKYFTINQMPVASSLYWNAVHGNTPDEVKQDLEGMQIMRALGNNMAWLIKSIKAGNVVPPEAEPRVRTNFIR